MKRLALSILLFVLTGAPGAQVASADQFSIRQCSGADFSNISGRYSSLYSDHVDVVAGCNGTGQNKIGIYQDRNNQKIPFGHGGQFLWFGSGEIQVIETTISAKLNSKNGIAARLIGANSANPSIALDGGSDHDGNPSLNHWKDPSQPVTVVVARLSCQLENGCENNSSSPKAFFELMDLEFSARDTKSPSVWASGELKDWSEDGKWHRGIASYSMTSGDQGSGISRSFLKVNGSLLNVSNASCPGAKTNYATSFNPCPPSHSYQGAVDTLQSPFQEGLNRVHFCSEDYSITASSGQPVCTDERWVFVDSRAPDTPIGLRVEGGSEWRSVNGFDLNWSNPAGQHSPVSGVEYSIYDDQGSLVQGPTRADGADVTSLTSVHVPTSGSFRILLRLVDAAGNVGQPASANLKFDDGRPGNVAPENTPTWLSADELPLRQSIERAAPGGPSGIQGYAMSISKDGPESPCPTGTCDQVDLTVAGGQEQRTVVVPDLTEGSHWISTVASSGARLSSESPQSVQVHVDKTDPVTTLEGVPTGWVNHPVTLIATSTDDSSGMSPAPGGDPVTVLEPADQSPYVSPGSYARFTIASEGVTVVKYWSRDLAGNANDGGIAPDGDRHRPPGSANVRIDSLAPDATFVAGTDKLDPELIRAYVRDRDSGVKDARIYFRRAGTNGEYVPLDSELRGGQVVARLPSDDLERGAYQLKIDSTDWAGNSAISSVDSSGEAMVLNVPLKEEVSLTAGLVTSKGLVSRIKISPNRRATLRGRLATKGGLPVAQSMVAVTESFAAGSRNKERVKHVRTDASGSFSLIVRRGPIRTMKLTYTGSPTLGKAESRALSIRTFDETNLAIHPETVRNGGTVRMAGSVRGPGGMTRMSGKLVAIQYYDPSRAKWRPAEVIRTNRKGRFSYRYRFRTIASAQRIIFRAASLPEAGWPFLPSTSKPRSVIVYPRSGR